MPGGNHKAKFGYSTSPVFAGVAQPLCHAFLTRSGQLSNGKHIDMNLCMSPENMTRAFLTYELVSHAFGMLHKKPVFLSQPHKNEVILLKDTPKTRFLSGYDGIVTNNSELILNVVTADCAPVLLSDTDGRCAAALHVGWRSLQMGIIANALEKINLLGSKNEHVLAAIGPAIHQNCYQVQEEIRYKLKTLLGNQVDDFFKEKDNNLWFDLPGAIEAVLLYQGIKPNHIWTSELCTCEHKEQFFSFRRDQTKARQLNFITLAHEPIRKAN